MSDGSFVCNALAPLFTVSLKLKAVDTTTGEYGTAALTVQVIPGKTTQLTGWPNSDQWDKNN